jgi:hypothetical protein
MSSKYLKGYDCMPITDDYMFFNIVHINLDSNRLVLSEEQNGVRGSIEVELGAAEAIVRS